MTLNDMLQTLATGNGRIVRMVVSRQDWSTATRLLAEGSWTLIALWAEPTMVHAAIFEPQSTAAGIISFRVEDGVFPSIGARHAPALRLERRIRDLFGLEPTGSPDLRPWIDHGQFDGELPGGTRARVAVGTDYAFLPVVGESLHEIPVGPVHAGIIEPGHFRFTASGETIVRLEERLGYVHRGIESLIKGAPFEKAARVAARTSGDSTVGYSIAFARAIEDAADVAIAPRAQFLRALMLELERIANHLGDIGAICNDAAFGLMHAHCGVLREKVLRVAASAFGHRLMMDCVIPGGVRGDLSREGASGLSALVRDIRGHFPRLMRMYDDTASLQDRTVGTGILSRKLVEQFAAGGFVGRASGRTFDARKVMPFPPYDVLSFDVAVGDQGDVDARIRVRAQEIKTSLSLIEQILSALPEGPVQSRIPAATGEGATLVEGFRGDIFAWVRLGAAGVIESSFLRDPSWFQWPLLEAAIEGNIVADFPLCNKSFNCSYAGHDL